MLKVLAILVQLLSILSVVIFGRYGVFLKVLGPVIINLLRC
nr:MAG TPA: hypothetical protein [Caudoviricetes sp.]